MLTLIQRELNELKTIIVMLFGATLTTIVVTCGLTISDMQDNSYSHHHRPPLGLPEPMLILFMIVLFFLPIIATAVGVNQMSMERTRKGAAFLCTLAVTRKKLMLNKILTGVLCVAMPVILVALADGLLLHSYPRLVPLDWELIVRLVLLALATNLAGYSLGLMMGWMQNSFVPSISSLGLAVLVVSIALIKGIDNIAFAILGLLIAAFMVRAWQRFMSTAL